MLPEDGTNPFGTGDQVISIEEGAVYTCLRLVEAQVGLKVISSGVWTKKGKKGKKKKGRQKKERSKISSNI